MQVRTQLCGILVKSNRNFFNREITKKIGITKQVVNLAYCTTSIITIKPSCYNIRSNQKLLLQPPPVKTLATLSDRSFASAAPALPGSSLYTSGNPVRLTVLNK